MAGRNLAEALRNFEEPLQRALSCIATGKLVFPQRGQLTLGRGYSWFANDLVQGVRLRSGFILYAAMWFAMVEDARPDYGPYRTSTTGYSHSLEGGSGEWFAFHWHPDRGFAAPHLHLGPELLRQDASITPRACW